LPTLQNAHSNSPAPGPPTSLNGFLVGSVGADG
jgi:hypothetical protein